MQTCGQGRSDYEANVIAALTPLSARLCKLCVVVRLEFHAHESWNALVAKARVGQAEEVVPESAVNVVVRSGSWWTWPLVGESVCCGQQRASG